MANLQVRDIDDRLYESLRERANREKRSISQEVVHILERYLSLPHAHDEDVTDEFLKLAGSWQDERSAEQIIVDIRGSRKNSARFGKRHELFD